MNALDTLGQTALHRAALAGHLQTCRLLLGYGADASLVSLQGFTAAQMGNEAVQQILNGRPAFVCVGWVAGWVCRCVGAVFWLLCTS